ncbi:hypothetical protein BVRB_4g087080 isoform B [Beta vulgaris subsp. vulgaris]|uniref:Uncharacterized protein n=1 Tax=Beta vulgaris subsp. vulgaris TaxID=3555 RepID=A0A0J8CH86_BETVV|nr:hypothetical protein BVRB_4g087080 isoform B [Beta vulgaris subsp. vulgaris]
MYLMSQTIFLKLKISRVRTLPRGKTSICSCISTHH